MIQLKNEMKALLVSIRQTESRSLLLQEDARHILERCISSPVSFDASAAPMDLTPDADERFTRQVESMVSPVQSSVEIGDVRPLYTELYPVRLYRDDIGMVHAVCRYFGDGEYRRFSPDVVDIASVDISNPSELFRFVLDFSDLFNEKLRNADI